MKIGILIGISILIILIYFISKKIKGNNLKMQGAKQIKLEELEPIMTQLLDGKLEYDFFGITSDGVDCIYFIDNKGKINIDFEVMLDDQKSYVQNLISFAKKNNYQITKMTYGNKPHYSGLKKAPVYRLALHADKHQAIEIGTEIMRIVFNKSRTTTFDIVP